MPTLRIQFLPAAQSALKRLPEDKWWPIQQTIEQHAHTVGRDASAKRRGVLAADGYEIGYSLQPDEGLFVVITITRRALKE